MVKHKAKVEDSPSSPEMLYSNNKLLNMLRWAQLRLLRLDDRLRQIGRKRVIGGERLLIRI
jgi:hypothetical protein